MQKFGSYLVIIGLLAVVLDYVNMVPRVLMWIYNWGNEIAWSIKVGLIVLGAIVWLIGSAKERQTA